MTTPPDHPSVAQPKHPFAGALARSYAGLPDTFHARVRPTPVSAPAWIRTNASLARELGLDPDLLETSESLQVLAGNQNPEGAEPVAMAYAGHQFGSWVPQLGDGRAILLGELTDPDGVLHDLHLKGAGPTPFSRRGDGRSSIGPVVREYLGSEAMAALGIPTTRALAAVHTGEEVLRQTGLEPGGILTRTARSHVRIGTFEYFARGGDRASLEQLLDHVTRRHYPELTRTEVPALALLEAVLGRTAELVAHWMSVGFIHGVMNTDNMSIVGETMDYGPFGFLDPWNPSEVYSSIDRQGRYAFGRQPDIAHWNLARLAETLLPLMPGGQESALEMARDVLDTFPDRFNAAWHRRLVQKIGFETPEQGAVELARELLDLMAEGSADMTWTFRELSRISFEEGDSAGGARGTGTDHLREAFDDPDAFDAWMARWQALLEAEGRPDHERRATMMGTNPAFVLRNHLAENAARAAVERLDWGPMEELLEVLARPFEDQPEFEALRQPPAQHERVTATFCGT